jgi:hypothetical protein
MSMTRVVSLLILGLATSLVTAGALDAQVTEHALESTDGLELINVSAEVVELEGRRGLRVGRADDYVEGGTLVLIEGTEFQNGVIELELAGEPASHADPNMRGFVGIAFRVDPADPDRYECFYLRPTNARADDQLRRNHSTQYVSHPDYPWYRLREESPGMYESYVDLEPGAWTKVRIEVAGKQARLYVHGADEPTLIVNDLKGDTVSGQVGLWLHSSTLAHFRNLRIRPAE